MENNEIVNKVTPSEKLYLERKTIIEDLFGKSETTEYELGDKVLLLDNTTLKTNRVT